VCVKNTASWVEWDILCTHSLLSCGWEVLANELRAVWHSWLQEQWMWHDMAHDLTGDARRQVPLLHGVSTVRSWHILPRIGVGGIKASTQKTPTLNLQAVLLVLHTISSLSPPQVYMGAGIDEVAMAKMNSHGYSLCSPVWDSESKQKMENSQTQCQQRAHGRCICITTLCTWLPMWVGGQPRDFWRVCDTFFLGEISSISSLYNTYWIPCLLLNLLNYSS